MKFALGIFLLLIFNSATIVRCESDLFPPERYDSPYDPGQQFGDDDEEVYGRLAYPNLRGSFPWSREQRPIVSQESKSYDDRLNEQVKAYKQLLDSKRPKFKSEFLKPYFLLYNTGANGFNHQYKVKHPNEQILDDIRPYPNEESYYPAVQENADLPVETSADMDKYQGGSHIMMHHPQPDVIPDDPPPPQQDHPQPFKDVKFVEDPTQFAYSPSDERFYETDFFGGYVDTNADKNPSVNNVQEQDSLPKQTLGTDIYINQRNGGLMLGGPTFKQLGSDVDIIAVRPHGQDPDSTGIYVLAIIAGVSAAAFVTLITLVITWFNLQKHVKNASDVEYPAYGVTGPNKDISPSGDRRLAQSAQMYHYQHQKQQIIAMERAAANDRHGSISEADSDEENEEGDYTVYECPGLAPTGEMEVKNPLFQDDPTPSAQTPQQKQEDVETK